MVENQRIIKQYQDRRREQKNRPFAQKAIDSQMPSSVYVYTLEI